jgi:hypothetical protein
MTGLQDDWQRTLKARRRAENPPPDELEVLDDDATTPRDHDATADTEDEVPAPRERGRVRAPRQAPSVTTARAMTVRMDPSEADDMDRFVLDLRDETGQRLDKAEVVRELLRLAQHNPSVRRALIKRLR